VDGHTASASNLGGREPKVLRAEPGIAEDAKPPDGGISTKPCSGKMTGRKRPINRLRENQFGEQTRIKNSGLLRKQPCAMNTPLVMIVKRRGEANPGAGLAVATALPAGIGLKPASEGATEKEAYRTRQKSARRRVTLAGCHARQKQVPELQGSTVQRRADAQVLTLAPGPARNKDNLEPADPPVPSLGSWLFQAAGSSPASSSESIGGAGSSCLAARSSFKIRVAWTSATRCLTGRGFDFVP
jgi:hypothetical protein